MSGSSFNYVCYKDAELLLRNGFDDVQKMGDELAAVGYAPDEARETFAVLAALRAAESEDRIDALIEPLRPVWDGMEQWCSGDWNEAQFKRALAEYRGIDLPTCSRCGGSGIEPGERYETCRNRGCAHGKDTAALTQQQRGV